MIEKCPVYVRSLAVRSRASPVPQYLRPRRAGRQSTQRLQRGRGCEASSSKGSCRSRSGPGGEHGRTGHFKAGLSFLFPGLPLFPHCSICKVEEV